LRSSPDRRAKFDGNGSRMAGHALPGHFAWKTTGEKSMKNHALALGLTTAALLATAGCSKSGGPGNEPQSAQTPKAQKAAGTKTIAAGLAPSSRFFAAAKAAG